jgi:peptidoglycan/LPS O-acetylase OafA/YrhL
MRGNVELNYPKNKAWRADIDGLRAVAVCFVLGYHFFPKWVPGGFIGVDIFFVISGYLIGGILVDALVADRFSLLDFYAHRIRRILPALLLVMGASLAFGWFALLPDDYQNIGKHMAGGAGFISNILLWQEAGYFDVVAHRKPLLHLWSLGIEEQFYIFLPLVLWGLWRKNLRHITFILLLVFLSYRWNIMVYKKDQILDFYAPMSRFWELLTGVLLALWKRENNNSGISVMASDSRLYQWRQDIGCFLNHLMKFGLRLLFREHDKVLVDRRGLGKALFSLLGVVLLSIALVRSESKLFPGKQAVVPVLATVCLIAAGQQAWWNRIVLAWRPLVWIGKISYPLYLWHWPLLAYTYIVLGEMPNELACLAIAGISVLLALLTYLIVERPIRYGKRAQNQKSILLIFLLGVLGGGGYYVFQEEGFPDRFKASRQMLMNLDTPPAHNNDCLQAYAGTLLGDPSVTFCLYSNVGSSETILLLGDSHARSAFVATAEYNAKRGRNTLMLGIAPKDWETRKDNSYSEALFRAVSDQKIKKVFLVSRSVMYIKGWDLDTPKFAFPRSDWLEVSVQYNIDRLRQLGKEVFVVAENPVLPFDPRKLLDVQPFRQVLRNFFGTMDSFQHDRQQVLEHQKEYLSALQRLRDASVIYSIDAFCPVRACMIFDQEGMPLYRDQNHLSTYAGGRFLVEKLLSPYLDGAEPRQERLSANQSSVH